MILEAAPHPTTDSKMDSLTSIAEDGDSAKELSDIKSIKNPNSSTGIPIPLRSDSPQRDYADKMEVQTEHRHGTTHTHKKTTSNDMEIVHDTTSSLPKYDDVPVGISLRHSGSNPSMSTTPPMNFPTHARKFSNDNTRREQLSSSGSPPLFSDPLVQKSYERRMDRHRLSQHNLMSLRIDTSILVDGNGSPTSRSLSSSGNSRPTTPTLQQLDAFSSPRGGSPRELAPDSPSILPRSPSTENNPRKKSLENFTLEEVLGVGSYGAVVRGVDKDTGAEYAIKILEKKHIMKEKKEKYVKTERDILGQCIHPGIVKLYYTFRSDSSLYYVLELCRRGELLGQIKQFGGLDEECAQFYTAEIVETLEYLHSKGIVHRDLKPENILLSAEGHLKLTDFGTSKILGQERNVRSNSFVGTPEYMAPELIITKETCCASDLWALGSIVYQMHANRLPFRGKTEFLTFQKVSAREIVYPLNFPPVAKDFIDKLLTVNPLERLGARAGGFDELKAHPFFTGIVWGSLRDRSPPPLKKPSFTLIFEELSPPPSPSSTPNLLRTSSSNILLAPGSPSNSPRMNSETRKWSKFLNPDEAVVRVGLVWKRKGFSVKQRYLILTNTPRLFYIEPKKLLVLGEIPWSEQLRPELKNAANFFIHTPKRKYVLEDTTHNAQKWVEDIQTAVNNYTPTNATNVSTPPPTKL